MSDDQTWVSVTLKQAEIDELDRLATDRFGTDDVSYRTVICRILHEVQNE